SAPRPSRRPLARPAPPADPPPAPTSPARRHARLNHVDLAVVRADGGAAFRPRAFDVVLANLSAPLLRTRVSELFALVRSGGALVLSGMRAEDVAEMTAACAEAGPLTPRVAGDWACLGGRRPGRP